MPAIGRLRYLEASASVEPARGTLVLLHAFPLTAQMWEGQMALAAHGWRVIAPQLRGFGGGTAGSAGSDDPPAASVDDYAGDVVDLLDALHIEQAVVGGLSMGGYVAFALLRRAPTYVRGLILADTRSQGDTPEGVEGRKKQLQLLAEQGDAGRETLVAQMLPKLLGASTRAERPDLAERVRELALSSGAPAIAGAIRALMTRPDSTSLLAAIRCPTLIVVGEEDVLTPPSFSTEMHRGIAGSTLQVIPGAGHLSSLEQPAAFNSALAAFLTHRL
jgi:3-oxoadipate enol-lactonase